MKNTICVLIALLLVAASVAVMYPSLLTKAAGQETVDAMLSEVAPDGDGKKLLETLGLEQFPFYREVHGVLAKCAPYIGGETAEKPGVWNMLSEIGRGENALETLYTFVIVALLTIPVYMILRLVPFNTLYNAARECSALGKPLAMGLTACAAAVSSVCVTWFLYHSLIFERLYRVALDYFTDLTVPQVALNVTNLVIIAALALAVIALLKSTLFRGSFGASALFALLRTVLFVAIFAAVNVFIGIATWRVGLFALIFVYVTGLVVDGIGVTEQRNR